MEDGVWRTIRGRRIFIKDGESLGSAMSRSGKFKREDIRTAKTEARFKSRADIITKKDNEKPAFKKGTKQYKKYFSK